MSDLSIKLLVLGESGVGKTSLIQRFVENKFEIKEVTVGMVLQTKNMKFDGKDYNIIMWDTAGQERFRSLPPQFYRNAAGVVLVYDIGRQETLLKLDNWISDVKQYTDTPDIAVIVVGNKLDEVRAVSSEDGLAFARKHRAMFMETSAKTDKNVREVFLDIAKQSIQSTSSRKTIETVVLNKTIDSPPKSKGGCCS